MPTIHFYPENHECPACGSGLNVQKTRPRTVITMHIGTFRAWKTVLVCPTCQTFFISEQLRSLVPKWGNFGFDVIVEVGLALFVHCRNNREIMKMLAAKNVFVSERQISCLGRKFIIYLAIAHQESQSHLRKLMAQRGGYILHVDGTCEGDSPNLFCALDGISELVLDTVKIPSEKKEQLVPFFQRVKDQYGEPMALVHDMGRGIVSAVEEVFPGVMDFICHFHFLRDVGKDLLQDEYSAFQKRLRKLEVRSRLRQRAKYLEHKIDPNFQAFDDIIASLESGTWRTISCEYFPLITVYTLSQWIFEYPQQSNGYGFPFDRPYLDFFRRLQNAHRLIEEIMDVHLRGIAKDNKPFYQIYKVLDRAVTDKQLNDLAVTLEQKAKVFDKLRSAMRIALPESKNGINDNGEDTDMKNIKEKVILFRKWLVSDDRKKTTYAKMIEQIDKYWEKLFADPLPVATSEGIMYIQPQRTNNILERFFRGEKRRSRKKTGTSSLNKVLKAILADTPLVQNLQNSEYVEIILNGCSSLAERFAQIDTCLVQKEMEKAKNSNEKILPAIRKLTKDSDLTIKISSLFSSYAK
ncbi:MAG: transposase [Deltaproteobacteria bacterium]|nr:MAG: transposase [Deltaproteobacteria bacterium]